MRNGFDIGGLAECWRDDASVLRQYGDVRMAEVCEQHAQAVEDAAREEGEILLTLKQAAKESGYSADHLGRLLRDGKIQNCGRKHAPRIRRGDLPMKPGLPAQRSPLQLVPTSREQIARAVVNSDVGGSDG